MLFDRINMIYGIGMEAWRSLEWMSGGVGEL